MRSRRRSRWHLACAGAFRPFIDEDDEEIEGAIWLNPFATTYYLGRGRHGDNSRLHRGIMLFRSEIEAARFRRYGFVYGRSR